MKKVMFFLLVVSIMASCSNSEGSGNREVTQIVKVKLANGDLDWVRLNTVEMRVYKEGDPIRINRTTHRIQTDSLHPRAIITSFIK